MKNYVFVYWGFLLLLFTQCSDNGQYRVGVELDSAFPIYVTDGVEYEHDGEIPDDPKCVFDSSDQKYHVYWDSVSGGEYTVFLNTIFLLSQTSRFDVSSDTVLMVKNELNLSSVDSFELSDLQDADTVEFVHISSGCFNYCLVKTILIKTKLGYSIRKIGPGSDPQLWDVGTSEGDSILSQIISMQRDMSTFRTEHNGTLKSSTSTQTFFIRADRRFFTFHDEAINWTGYKKFEQDSTRI